MSDSEKQEQFFSSDGLEDPEHLDQYQPENMSSAEALRQLQEMFPTHDMETLKEHLHRASKLPSVTLDMTFVTAVESLCAHNLDEDSVSRHSTVYVERDEKQMRDDARKAFFGADLQKIDDYRKQQRENKPTKKESNPTFGNF